MSPPQRPAALKSDSDNLFLVLSARELNRGLRIVSRAIDFSSRAKLAKAGADAVVMPDMIGGLRIASEILRPSVVSFLDLMLRQSGEQYRLEEATVSAESSVVGQELGKVPILQKTGLVLYGHPAGRGSTLHVRSQPGRAAAGRRRAGGYRHAGADGGAAAPGGFYVIASARDTYRKT